MKKIFLFLSIASYFFIFSPNLVLSQQPTCPPQVPNCHATGRPPLAAAEQLGCGEGFGPFASVLCGRSFNLGTIINSFFSNILGFLTVIAGIYFFFQIITAGIAWVGAGGDKNNVEQARSKIINALIGIVVVASAWVLVGIVGQFIGFNILDVGGMIDKLRL